MAKMKDGKWYGVRASGVGTLSQGVTQNWDEVQALAHDHKSPKVRALMYRNFHSFATEAEARAYSVQDAYSAPASVLTVLGVHGLPLPPPAKKLAAAAAAASMPVNVTPAVIGAAYDVAGVKVDRSAKSKNRQAVAEFQGQTMNSSDLKKFFAKFVPGAKAGDEVCCAPVPLLPVLTTCACCCPTALVAPVC